ncbi:MAG: cation transporter [Magnetococcales bacterium]|nr:cation transporter [Magnetococcales bacterium]
MSCFRYHPHTPYLVSHTLHMKHLAEGEAVQSVRVRLSGLPGVSSVTCEPDAGLVSVIYDLRKLRMEEIETALHDMGIASKDDFFSNLRHAISHVVEELEEDYQSAEMHKPDYAHSPFLYRRLAEEGARVAGGLVHSP